MSNGLPFEHCEFEISPFATKLTGTLKATVYEDGGVDPTTIIRVDESWHVDIEWTLKGHIRRHLCGEWCVTVHLESVGPGNEYTLPNPAVHFPIDPCNDGNYKYTIKVPAGTIQPEDCGTLFLLAVTLTSLDGCKKSGHIAAYCKGPDLMFYVGTDED